MSRHRAVVTTAPVTTAPVTTAPVTIAIATTAVAAGLLLAACGGGDQPEPSGRATTPGASPTGTAPTAPSGTAGPAARPAARPVPTVGGDLATDLAVPWSVVALPDAAWLLSERDSGRIVRVAPDGTTTSLGVVPGVRHGGEGGLLGLAVPGDFASSPRVYAYFTSEQDNRVVVLPLVAGRLGAPRTVLSGIPAANIHNGGRLAFGPDGTLYVGTGDAANREASQDRRSLGGKILRIRADGSVPPDNPFPGSPVWSYGHRNVQGLAFDSAGRLWASEFGQNTYDELNLIEKGKDYGWPVVEGVGGDPRFVDPQVTWATSEASPSGIAIVADVVYMAGLRGQRLWQVPVTGGRAGTPEAFLTRQYGRLRAVTATPDGGLLVGTSNRDGRGNPRPDDDRLLQVRLG